MDVSETLLGFGFTQVEALVYCQLLRDSPATGYRLARQVGKSPTNIYQTLNGLLQKGAISEIEGEGSTTTYVAIPPAQLLSGLATAFKDRHDAALIALEGLHRPPTDETVSQLRTVAQVLERARAMLRGAGETLIFDMVPAVYDLMRPDLDAARARGLRVAGIAYRAADACALMPFNGEQPADVTRRWPGLGMILIADGRELLVAQLSRDFERVLNAVYSDSEFLSAVMHSAVSSDIRLVALAPDGTDPLGILALRRSPPPGLRTLNDGPAGDTDPAPRCAPASSSGLIIPDA
jgi:sugar-specific transcriptional regulator TrmB